MKVASSMSPGGPYVRAYVYMAPHSVASKIMILYSPASYLDLISLRRSRGIFELTCAGWHPRTPHLMAHEFDVSIMDCLAISERWDAEGHPKQHVPIPVSSFSLSCANLLRTQLFSSNPLHTDSDVHKQLARLTLKQKSPFLHLAKLLIHWGQSFCDRRVS